jgi:hypothetical protein
MYNTFSCLFWVKQWGSLGGESGIYTSLLIPWECDQRKFSSRESTERETDLCEWGYLCEKGTELQDRKNNPSLYLHSSLFFTLSTNSSHIFSRQLSCYSQDSMAPKCTFTIVRYQVGARVILPVKIYSGFFETPMIGNNFYFMH